MKNKLENESGFTLVELMVVVAIIGILSAVAIPQFQTYQAKSKTAEAKIQLSAIYQAQISLSSDYDSFATCLAFSGFTRAGVGQYFYAVGFGATENALNTDVRTNGGGGCANGQTFRFAATKVVGGYTAPAGAVRPAITGMTSNTFTAAAVGGIHSDFNTNATASSWTVDQDKVFVNLVLGY